MIAKLFLAASLTTVLSGIFFACSSPDLYDTNNTAPVAKGSPSPTPTPSPTPKPTVWTCKISNGAGRIFTATDEVRDVAEFHAHHECSIYSRNCVLLDCNPHEAD